MKPPGDLTLPHLAPNDHRAMDDDLIQVLDLITRPVLGPYDILAGIIERLIRSVEGKRDESGELHPKLVHPGWECRWMTNRTVMWGGFGDSRLYPLSDPLLAVFTEMIRLRMDPHDALDADGRPTALINALAKYLRR